MSASTLTTQWMIGLSNPCSKDRMLFDGLSVVEQKRERQLKGAAISLVKATVTGPLGIFPEDVSRRQTKHLFKKVLLAPLNTEMGKDFRQWKPGARFRPIGLLPEQGAHRQRPLPNNLPHSS